MAKERVWGLLAEFESPGALIKGAEVVRDAGFKKWDCHSPFPVHGIDPAMGIKFTILPLIVFGAGISGTGLAILMQWWMNTIDYRWLVSGKPFFSLPANIPIAFEGTVLIAAITCFFTMWGLNKLPQVWHPLFSKDRFLKATDDGFFVSIEADDAEFDLDKTRRMLEEAGATAVEDVRYVTGPETQRIPSKLLAMILISSVAALVPFAMVAKLRASKSDKPHYHIIPNMDFTPAVGAQDASSVFADGRGTRVPVEGTVARGMLKDDDHFYRGIIDGHWATQFPPQLEISQKTMDRGQNRFNIYCSPCHGVDGSGKGMVDKRALQVGADATGWVSPSNLHQEYVIRLPHGQIFNTISHGVRTMPSYKAQIKEEDRWAIVLYLRALQRSQHATIDDVPEQKRSQIR